MAYCKICGEYECKKHGFVLGKVKDISEFSGSSPPEVFVGKWNYPNVYIGILSPERTGDTKLMSSAEQWHLNKMQIPDILSLRKELIYGRTVGNIKKAVNGGKFLDAMQEIAMTDKSVLTEFKLNKSIRKNDEKEKRVPLISNAADVKRVRITENIKIEKKVDYLVNDIDVKSSQSLLELSNAGITSSSLIKLLSAGLLGLRKNRKLIPTRWSITAVDDTLSKEKLSRIRDYSELDEIKVFWAEYLGNHYEFILLPDKYSFEVIELSMKNFSVWQDYEGFFPRKKYADVVTGAYYANRLAVTEYLDRIKRQARCIVFREVRPEYYAPLGVGILRECSREAFRSKGECFSNVKDALDSVDKRLRTSVSLFKEKSVLLQNYRVQKIINEFI